MNQHLENFLGNGLHYWIFVTGQPLDRVGGSHVANLTESSQRSYAHYDIRVSEQFDQRGQCTAFATGAQDPADLRSSLGIRLGKRRNQATFILARLQIHMSAALLADGGSGLQFAPALGTDDQHEPPTWLPASAPKSAPKLASMLESRSISDLRSELQRSREQPKSTLVPYN